MSHILPVKSENIGHFPGYPHSRVVQGIQNYNGL